MLLDVKPACKIAYVSEMAQKIDAERRELICAKKSTKSIIDSIIKVVSEMQRIDANYKDKQDNKGETKVKLDEIKATLTAELGEEIVADWTDEDFQNEVKVTEARQAKEAKIEAEKVEAERVEAERIIEEERTSKSKAVVADDGSEAITEESVIVTRVDGKEVYRRKSNDEIMYAESDYAELQAKIEELESALVSKDSEIEVVRANAQEIAKLKIEHKGNEFTAEFSDEDWLQAEKIQEAVSKKEIAELIVKNKEALKENEFAKDFSDEDYANETKVELATIKAENKVLQEKVPVATTEVVVAVKKEEDMDPGVVKVKEGIHANINPISRMMLEARKEKKEKLEAKTKLEASKK